MKFKLALLCTLLGAAAGNAMACYTVYGAGNQVVYHAQTPPVDMSLPLHQTLPQAYPGGHMVFGDSADCPKVSSVAPSRVLPRTPVAVASRSTSPILTDKRTAQAMHAPHVMLSSNIALVDPRSAALPAAAILPAALDVPEVVAAAPVPARTRGTVITEMRDPPMTVVQSSAGVVVSEYRN